MTTATATKENMKLLTLTQVKERGWTASLVENFLGTPDVTKTNPLYRSAAPMKLYAKERVEAIEATSEFQQARAKVAVRSQATQRAAAVREEARRESMAAIIGQEVAKGAEVGQRLEVTVTRLPLAEVQRLALEAYKEDWGGKECDPTLVERNAVNFIRHRLTKYDDNYEFLPTSSNVAWETSRYILRRRVYDEIARTYPEYAEECQRQMAIRQPEQFKGLPPLPTLLAL